MDDKPLQDRTSRLKLPRPDTSIPWNDGHSAMRSTVWALPSPFTAESPPTAEGLSSFLASLAPAVEDMSAALASEPLIQVLALQRKANVVHVLKHHVEHDRPLWPAAFFPTLEVATDDPDVRENVVIDEAMS